ncbi:ABC transporter ATP-binding protein [Fundidesulfovibrio butyratiphilus]
MTELLRVRGASVRFGGVQALSEVGLDIPHRAVVSVIGPNGAGKTTLLGVISGAVASPGARIELAGSDIGGQKPHQRARAGVVRTFQNLEIFTTMSVVENVMTGAHLLARYSVLDSVLRTPRFHREERRLRELALERLAFVGLVDKAALPAGDLPYGEQRLLELARALASSPKLLLLDEPAAGMNTRETAALAKLIARVRDKLGVGVLLVEHDMDLVMDISDQVTVLNFGRVLAQGEPAVVQANPEVVAAYLGEDQ